MAIQRGRDLLAKSNATAEELQKSIAALRKDSEYVRKCIKAGLRDAESGHAVMQEIADLITELEEKLKCTN
jgi:predicted  nucleic acid-binding Zn-ribbon protein